MGENFLSNSLHLTVSSWRFRFRCSTLLTLPDEDCPCPDAWEDVPTSRRTSSGTDSEEAFEKVQEWIDDCISGDHEFCVPPEASALPTRVIDVGRKNGVIRVIESHGKTGNYLALSHCWGRQQIITTTKATLDDRKKEIPASKLSKTFLDAVTMTRRLGFDYIWIDSMCIVQDDAQDWERESAEMAAIYKNAYLTLAATRSSSGAGGLILRTPDFEVSGSTPEGEEYFLIFREKVEHDMGLMPDGAQNFPLMSRAWVCQERLLAPRTLHFGYHELFYECLTDQSCECGEVGFMGPSEEVTLPSVKLMYASALDSAPVEVPLQLVQYAVYHAARVWRSIVVYYTGLDITASSDRLPALSGIASDMAQTRKCSYFAGIWESSLLDDLVWVTYSRKSTRPTSWRAPTWSWASIEGQVHYGDAFVYWYQDMWKEDREKCEYYAKSVKVECSPAGLNKYGQVMAGILRLSGPIITGPLKYGTDDAGKPQTMIQFDGNVTLPFWPDYEFSQDAPFHVLQNTLLLCMRVRTDVESKKDISIVLRKSPNDPDMFERIGLLHIYAARTTDTMAAELFRKAADQEVDII